jgi:hypothetical protein
MASAERGAYSRFKRLLNDEGRLDRWFPYEQPDLLGKWRKGSRPLYPSQLSPNAGSTCRANAMRPVT